MADFCLLEERCDYGCICYKTGTYWAFVDDASGFVLELLLAELILMHLTTYL